MKRSLDFNYDPETHTTTCFRRVKDTIFIGKAKCHPSDYDFESKLVGEHYAYMRSVIKELQLNKEEYKQQLKILKHVYTLFEQNSEVDLTSKECYYVKRQIENVKEQIDFCKNMIQTIKDGLKDTMKKKDDLYAKLRAKRMGND